MNFEPLPYCTNVHPGEALSEIRAALEETAVPLRHRLLGAQAGPYPLGLRLGERAVAEVLADEAGADEFRAFLARHAFTVETLNVFPQGEFHAEVVKEAVYEPDWSRPERLRFTVDAARALARLMPPQSRFGSLSTVPLGDRRGFPARAGASARHLIELVTELARLEAETGKELFCALEPEPECALETVGDALAFFEEHLLALAGSIPEIDGVGGEARLRRHLGLCYDVCHAAVAFAEPAYDFLRLAQEGIRVGKVQLSSALELGQPLHNPEGIARLREFVEVRFLHQVQAMPASRERLRWRDLPDFLADCDAGTLPEVDTVRCHFHVPIHLPDAWPLATTRGLIDETLSALPSLPDRPHLEIETYTFEVMSRARGGRSGDLLNSLEEETRYADEVLARFRETP